MLKWIKLKFISKDSWILRSFGLVCIQTLSLWPHQPVTTDTVATPFALQIVMAWKLPHLKYHPAISECLRGNGIGLLGFSSCLYTVFPALLPSWFTAILSPSVFIPTFHDPTATLMPWHHSVSPAIFAHPHWLCQHSYCWVQRLK